MYCRRQLPQNHLRTSSGWVRFYFWLVVKSAITQEQNKWNFFWHSFENLSLWLFSFQQRDELHQFKPSNSRGSFAWCGLLGSEVHHILCGGIWKWCGYVVNLYQEALALHGKLVCPVLGLSWLLHWFAHYAIGTHMSLEASRLYLANQCAQFVLQLPNQRIDMLSLCFDFWPISLCAISTKIH